MAEEQNERNIEDRTKGSGGALAGLLLVLLFPFLYTLIVTGNAGAAPKRRLPGVFIQREDQSQIPLEEYVPKLVAAELPTECIDGPKPRLAFFEVMSILARTEILKVLDPEKHKIAEDTYRIPEAELMTQGWDKAQVQAAWGRACYEQVYPFVLVGAANTSGQVLCFRGEPIYPMYHYANAGVSRTHGSLPYLQSVSCPKDHLAPGAYKTIALPKEAGVLVELWQTDQQGYCEEIALGDIHEPAESFSRDHDLPSVYYTLEEGKEAYLVTALGRGSGYGLSQWTALQMALEGKNAGEILGYFYKGCEIP